MNFTNIAICGLVLSGLVESPWPFVAALLLGASVALLQIAAKA